MIRSTEADLDRSIACTDDGIPHASPLIPEHRSEMHMSPFGDIMDGGRDTMTLESTIETPAEAGAIIRARRMHRGLSQQTLADMFLELGLIPERVDVASATLPGQVTD